MVFLFKLNVQPHILKRYSSQQLFESHIPSKFSSAFSDLFTQVEIRNQNLSFQIENDYKYIVESLEYQQLLADTDMFIEQYKQITFDYQNKEGIHFSDEFLTERDRLIESRKHLTNIFPVLNDANGKFDSKQINQVIEDEYQFTVDSEIGKGIDHIRRVQKIKLYLKELLNTEDEIIDVQYEYGSEIVSIDVDNQNVALDLSKAIEKALNNSKNEVGDVNINPIYENLVLNTTDNMKSIEIVVVYPNGNTDEEFELLSGAKKTQSRELRAEFVASDFEDNKQFLKNTKKLTDIPAEKGYLKAVKNNNKSIIDFEKTTIKMRIINE